MRLFVSLGILLLVSQLVMGQEIVAHRGASFDAPENTLAAFRLAWEQGADAVEGDFYLTADQKIVCLHDKDTKRTAPNQASRVVSKSTLAELQQLDVGRWKDEKYKGEKIPTLQEVLKVIPANKKILIEIKCGTEIVPVLKTQLADSGLKDDQIIVICFNPAVIKAVRSSMPQYKANWLTSYRNDAKTGSWSPTQDEIIQQLKGCDATGLGTQGRRNVIDASFCDRVTKAGFELHVWTINEINDAAYYQGLNFASITTDRPEYIRRSLPGNRDQSEASRGGSVGYRLSRQTIRHGYDGKECWVHARMGVVRDQQNGAAEQVVMTSQLLDVKGSDTFSAISSSTSPAGHGEWTDLIAQPGFARWKVGDGLEETICDFTPTWHESSGKLLGTGQSVRYENGRVMKVRPRYTAYSVYDPAKNSWAPPKQLRMPDQPRFKNCGAGSVQRYDKEDGDILLPVYFKEPASSDYSVAVCLCSFDGTEMKYLRHGNELTVKGGRGLYEPSVTKVGKRYFLTLRNDETGYVCTSEDGLQYDKPKPWMFDDGENLGNYNTQQHWARNGDHLYLIYTRRGADNDHVFRNRAPLFMARVDQESMTVVRSTERILVPERGARLGNFGVMEFSDQSTWVVVSEWMQTWRQSSVIIPVDNERGADNSIYLVKIDWDPT